MPHPPQLALYGSSYDRTVQMAESDVISNVDSMFNSELKWSSRPIVFHTNTGRGINLSKNKCLVTRRTNDWACGIVFTEEPVSLGQMLKVTMVERVGRYTGGLQLGFTGEDPETSTLTQQDYLLWQPNNKHLVAIGNTNVSSNNLLICELDFNTKNITEGQSVGILFTIKRDLHWFVDDEWRGVVNVDGYPLDKPMWGVMDVYGKCKEIKAEICTVSKYSPSSEAQLIKMELITPPQPKSKPQPKSSAWWQKFKMQKLTEKSTCSESVTTLLQLRTQLELGLSQANASIQQLHTQIEDLQTQNEGLQEQNDGLQTKMVHYTHKTQQRIEGLRQELIRTNQQLVNKHKQLTSTQQKLSGKQQMLASAQQQLMNTQQELSQANERRQRSDTENQQLIATLRQQNDVLQRRVTSLSAANRSQNSQEGEFWQVSPEEVTVRGDEILGGGAWGYVAKGTFRGTPVAVKRVYPAILQMSTVERIRREIRTMAQIRHPNLVLFIAAVLSEQTGPMIVTELLDTSLRSAYQTKRVGRNKRKIFGDVSSALVYLHGQREPIIHRDVSSANVLLASQPNDTWLAKLADFGSANLARYATTPGEGAILYTAPEVYPHSPTSPTPGPPQTTKIDVYSFGVVACEVVTAVFPESDKWRGLLERVGGVWPQLHPLITSCVSHSPQDRPTMDSVLSQIKQLDWEP